MWKEVVSLGDDSLNYFKLLGACSKKYNKKEVRLCRVL